MSTAIRSSIARIVLALGVAACSASGGSRGDIPQPRTRAGEPKRPDPGAKQARRAQGAGELPLLGRDALVDPMRAHGDNLESLLWTTLMLDYASTATIASWIADEPRLSRPGAVRDVLNASLPPQFFDLQDELYANAGDLARAAREEDDAAMGDAFSRLSRTCIRCHSIYLRSARRDKPR